MAPSWRRVEEHWHMKVEYKNFWELINMSKEVKR